ncbi:MAG: MFS transporter [bacterium]
MIRHGTPEFRRTNLALFSAGFATLALLYCVQPLMPVFAREFHVTAAQSSLSLSLTTGLLAPAMIIAGAFSETRGRKRIMVVSLLGASLLTIAAAFATKWEVFLALRALAGLSFAGLPAISMAYLAEEVDPVSIGLAVGLAIGGNGFGGMTGRLLTATLTDAYSWRVALGTMGVLGLVATAIFARTLPPSRHFAARPLRLPALLAIYWEQLRDARLIPLYATGFLVMGSFVTTYNYITYYLLGPPYLLSHAKVGLIFIVYLFGIVGSAWIGSHAVRVGRRRMLMLMLTVMLGGVGLTLLRPLPLVIAGIAVVTFALFGAHSVASAWSGQRAHRAKGQATALYLFFYYMGSSVAGAAGGLFWQSGGWPAVAAYITTMLLFALAATATASAT